MFENLSGVLLCTIPQQRELLDSSKMSPDQTKKSPLVPLAIWAVFLAGLLLQAFSPHLRIDHDSFVMPADGISRGVPIDPRALVKQQKTMQLCSALLAVAGAAGLAIYYRRTLFRHLPGQSEE
jgi:hypothetical protein